MSGGPILDEKANVQDPQKRTDKGKGKAFDDSKSWKANLARKDKLEAREFKLACKASQMESVGARGTYGTPTSQNSENGSNPWSDATAPEVEPLSFSHLLSQAIAEKSITQVQRGLKNLVKELALVYKQSNILILNWQRLR
ncbi:hypothetical protein R1flu_028030 [Riccia fluitans]|uniref:Uncharacterized protein n=1 Tax=Riccia fluitans TaxID=41844 RepID=A0ABD1XKH8_9MARC